MGVPEPDEVDDPLDNRAVERGIDLFDRIVVPVDRPAISGPLDCRVVVLASQQPDVVDLRNALREQLDRPRRDVSLIVTGERAVIPTGVAVALPDGYAAFVHPRSGLAARAGLALLNSPGTVDSGYRGEVKVIAVNHDPVTPLELRRGERIAQLVIQRVERARFVEVAELPISDRGAGGYGSTGGAAALLTDRGV